MENKEIYEFGPFRLDVGEHIFQREDGVSNGSLPEKAFQTLVVLVRNRGRLVSKNALMDAVWPDAIVEENNLDKCIHHIRHALRDRPGEQRYIETVRKHGYRFIADVKAIEADPFDCEADISRTDVPPSTAVENGNGVARPILFENEPKPDDPEHLAILTERGRPNRLYWKIAAGGLTVIAGLGGWLIASERLNVAVSEYNASPGGARMATENTGHEARHSPAFDLYVRGKVKVGSENREDTAAAIQLLEEAVATDPSLAEAYAQLARAYNTMAFKYSSGSERIRLHENAEVAIEKALALDPDLAEGHFARGLILWTNSEGFPHDQAIQSYKRSLALDDGWDETHHQLSFVYSHIGLLDKAEHSIKRALEINPNNTLARFRVGVYQQYQGKFDEALTVFKTIPREHTPLLMERSLAETLIQIGRPAEAEEIAENYLRRFPQDEGGSFTSVMALLHAKAGRHGEAEQMIRRAIELGSEFGHFHHTAYNIGSAYAAMNKPDEAVEWLEKSADKGFPNYPYFEIDPNLQPLREHRLFQELMTKLKIGWERFKAEV